MYPNRREKEVGFEAWPRAFLVEYTTTRTTALLTMNSQFLKEFEASSSIFVFRSETVFKKNPFFEILSTEERLGRPPMMQLQKKKRG